MEIVPTFADGDGVVVFLLLGLACDEVKLPLFVKLSDNSVSEQFFFGSFTNSNGERHLRFMDNAFRRTREKNASYEIWEMLRIFFANKASFVLSHSFGHFSRLIFRYLPIYPSDSVEVLTTSNYVGKKLSGNMQVTGMPLKAQSAIVSFFCDWVGCSLEHISTCVVAFLFKQVQTIETTRGQEM